MVPNAGTQHSAVCSNSVVWFRVVLSVGLQPHVAWWADGRAAGSIEAVWVAASSQVENRRVQWARLVMPLRRQRRPAVAGRTMLGRG